MSRKGFCGSVRFLMQALALPFWMHADGCTGDRQVLF
jgi:hypothetical protein